MAWTQTAVTCADFSKLEHADHSAPPHATDDCIVIYLERDDGWVAWASHGDADVEGRKNPDLPLVDMRRSIKAR